jgi:hypothetical protein
MYPVLLPLGGNPIAVKYIYHIISYHIHISPFNKPSIGCVEERKIKPYVSKQYSSQATKSTNNHTYKTFNYSVYGRRMRRMRRRQGGGGGSRLGGRGGGGAGGKKKLLS